MKRLGAVPPIVTQRGLPGVQEDRVAGDQITRLKFILRTFDDARNNQTTAIARYWLLFDGLADQVTDPDAFLAWLITQATPFNGLLRRLQELQGTYIDLEPDDPVKEDRKRKSRQPRGRR